ncbi:MAG: sulfatase family protein [Pleomorphochaeta sp.]
MSNKKKYNVLLITSDQQHFDTIGKFNKEIKTPNLDRLCESGTCFDRAYTVNPTCTPARASIITGKYPSQHGAWTLGTKLDENCTTIGELMQKEGIKTSLIGKAHFQPLESNDTYPSLEAYPTLQDIEFWKTFDKDFYGFEDVKLARNHTNESHVGQNYVAWLKENGCDNYKDYFLPPTGNMDINQKYIWDIPEKYHYDKWIAEETNNKLEEYSKNGKQFFCWASFFDPHPQYLVPKNWANMYDSESLTLPKLVEGELLNATDLHKLTQEENPDFSKYSDSGWAIHGCHSQLKNEKEAKKELAIYYSMVSLMDKYIGKILDKLDELNLTENTLIVFTTDHGNFMGQHGLYEKGPAVYEDAIKIPFIASLKGVIKENVVNSSLQSLVDLPITFLDYCNLSIPFDFTGVNQRLVWEGKKEKAREHIICEHNHERNLINMRVYVNKRYKLVIYYNNKHGELYDLVNDPNELNNLWDKEEYSKLQKELMLKYMWAELEKESLFMPRIAHA